MKSVLDFWLYKDEEVLKMYDQSKHLFSWGDIENKIYDCLLAMGNAIQMDLSNPKYVWKSVKVDEIDLNSAEEQYGATKDFISNFLDEVNNIDYEDPVHIPSMEVLMKLIGSTGLGARAFGFIDTNEQLVDSNGEFLSTFDTVKRLITESPDEDIYLKIADLFEIKEDELKNVLESGKGYIPLRNFIKLSVKTVLQFTLMIGAPIQFLFGYKFYSLCDELYSG